jgi:predicted transcriptional regulator of viral defense system
VEPLREWLDAQYARGRTAFTLDEYRRERGVSDDAAFSALARAQRAHLVASPTRGLYAIVPAEYRVDGAPPWQWYLDAMFRRLDAAYYVGLLTAAAQHGASAQVAQEVQVVTDRHVRDRRVGRQRLAFIHSARAATAPTEVRKTPTGSVRVSTPEMTMLDLVAYPKRAGGWSNIASLVRDLSEATSRSGWKEALRVGPATAQVQRLGHMLERAQARDTDVLAQWLAPRRADLVTLVPGSDREGPVDRRWRVIGDPGIQPD